MADKLMTFQDLKYGIQQVMLNIKALYSNQQHREEFLKRFSEFLESDPFNESVFEQTKDIITYRTECIIPTKLDQRPPILAVFGNPAPHSICSEMFFAYEGSGKEHRIWKILDKSGILSFPPASAKNIDEINLHRKRAMFELDYESPFRIGLTVLYTMPSPASHYKWAGVQGLRRLFGKEALLKIQECEKERLDKIIKDYMNPYGAVIAFQKDAYLALESSESPDYTVARAKAGQLIGNCRCNPEIRLFCSPPTRVLLGHLNVLRDFRNCISNLASPHN